MLSGSEMGLDRRPRPSYAAGMGRRGVPIGDPSRWVFNRLVEDYRRRPPYPEGMVDRLAALAGPGGRVADLGAGVGHLAVPLARRGLRVAAVEPAEAMLAALREAAAAAPGRIEPVHAAAEETGLEGASFDLVLVADALHWIDAQRGGAEMGRLLAPGGALAVVEAEPEASPFMAALGGLLSRANPREPPPPAARRRQLLALAGATAAPAERFAQVALLDDPGLEALLRSLTHVGPALGPEALAGLLEEARRLAERHGGARWARALTLTWGRRRA